MKPFLLHATAVMVGGHAVALCGKSGSGKSDLALRLIDRGATLIGDDYVEIADDDGKLICSHKAEIAGQLEVRGVGIATLPFIEAAHMRLAVQLDQPVERLPEADVATVANYNVPSINLNAFESSAPNKVELALRMVVDAGRFPLRISLP